MNNVTDEFSKRIKKLRGEKSQQEVADKIGISRVSLGYYESGDRKPDIEVLSKLSNYFNVTTDYLLGLSDNSTTDLGIQDICKKTGLSDKAVENIIKLNTHGIINESKWLKGLDYILSQTIEIDILNHEPDNEYWNSTKKEKYKSSVSTFINGEKKFIFYFGIGMEFLSDLNDILFNKYVDINPYTPVGKSGNMISVIDKKKLLCST